MLTCRLMIFTPSFRCSMPRRHADGMPRCCYAADATPPCRGADACFHITEFVAFAFCWVVAYCCIDGAMLRYAAPFRWRLFHYFSRCLIILPKMPRLIFFFVSYTAADTDAFSAFFRASMLMLCRHAFYHFLRCFDMPLILMPLAALPLRCRDDALYRWCWLFALYTDCW